jgi:hypothetical protein
VKKKIANRKDKKAMKKKQENGFGKAKIYIRGRRKRSKRKGKVTVDKTESIKNISKKIRKTWNGKKRV